MKLNIEEKRDNPLLERVEVVFTIDHENESTPKKATIQEALVKELGEEKERVEITKVFTKTGVCKSRAWATVNKGEIVKKEESAEKPPEVDAPESKEAPSEEKQETSDQDKAEEKKEEKPAEEKKEEPAKEDSKE